jgi:hypothetical protein
MAARGAEDRGSRKTGLSILDPLSSATYRSEQWNAWPAAGDLAAQVSVAVDQDSAGDQEP